jgi:LPS-assembly lipoprotein
MAGMARRAVLPMLALPVLAACGFHPVYGPAASGGDSPAAAALAKIQVGLIPDRSGQILRLALQERFERAGMAEAHQYDLSVSFAVASSALAIEPDSVATWIRLVGTANYRLTSQDPSRATLTSGVARSVDGYNLFDQQYFAQDMENDAVEKRIALALADQIALQLASYFTKQAAGPRG